jgi:hypothetical protein
MKKVVFLALLAYSAITTPADYKPDWFAEVFHMEVSTCRTAIVIPAIKGYLDEAAAGGVSDDSLRIDAISMLPAFEHFASIACFCAVSELAKTLNYRNYFGSGDFGGRMSALRIYLDGPVCSARVKEAQRASEMNEILDTIRLR